MTDKEQFKTKLLQKLKQQDIANPADADAQQMHRAVAGVVMDEIAADWGKSKAAHQSGKRACYFSMEFLIGRAIYNNLMARGLTESVQAFLNRYDFPLARFEEVEDAALGNGGLGRLAACFLESAATTGVPLDGYGIYYKYGLFKQRFENGFQMESADDWTKYGDPWSKRVDAEEQLIQYADFSVRAVPYDIPILGYDTDNVSTLRLWQAQAVEEFYFDLFNKQEYIEAGKAKILAEDISRVLYPNDDTDEGKLLRIRQEYFFTAASVRDIIKKHLHGGYALAALPEKIFIQLNDTHPVFAIPELLRLLTDEHGMSFEAALEIAKKSFAYTNHTVMSEALEKWNVTLIKKILPRIYEIIFQLHESMMNELTAKRTEKALVSKTKIIQGETVHMANLAIYASSYVNGVAQLHTEILKKETLKEWYSICPDHFQNKTNGITPRRWLALCNRELSALITEYLGDSWWVTDLDRLSALRKYADDDATLRRFGKIKKQKKAQLAEFVLAREGITLSPDSIFDIQIKRLHEYKRQLLNAFSILYIYFGIKDGSIQDFYPTTFLFGAKSAPGYARAKAIIKYINEIARLVNNDADTASLLRVVFVQNYNVSYAEKLVCAADVSEQISTAGTEASGTGNMKFMLNGTVTLGTLDGANVEIVEEAGIENNYIFGARTEQLPELMKHYEPRVILQENPKIRRVINTLIDGIVSDGGTGSTGGTGSFRELYISLLEGASWHVPDNYYILGDLQDYVDAKLRVNRDYQNNNREFLRKCWFNMAAAGKFSADRTIRQYAAEIWGVGTQK